MKTKIIAWLVLTGLATAWTITYAASWDTTNSWSFINKMKHKLEFSWSGCEMMWKKWWMMMWGKMSKWMWFGMMWSKVELTDEEKTKLQSMTDSEKQAFFEQKRTETESKIEAREAVMDKLLNWETLTDSDKVIVEEIKTQRAEAKKQREEMRAKMEEIKPILEKKKAWTTLTTDEQTKLDEFMKNNWMKNKRWMFR